MKEVARRLAEVLTGAPRLPPLLNTVLDALESSPWSEVLATWSHLTPSGFPVEFTVGPALLPLRWTAEVAGPEVSECERLLLVADFLGMNGHGLEPDQLDALVAAQSEADLRWGAWVGGREDAGSAARLKLYAELPRSVDLAALLVPGPVRTVLDRLPSGAEPCMLGVEPVRGRTEIYFRLPTTEVLDLLPFLHATGHASAVSALQRALPDGVQRLRGRRQGVSVAFGPDTAMEIALFASARTLFPIEPAQLVQLAPHYGRLDPDIGRPGLVTMGLDRSGLCVPVTIGCSPRARRRPPRFTLSDRATWCPPVRRKRPGAVAPS